jgi:hypothetical protein
MPTPIQDEPESTVGKKPARPPDRPEPPERERARSGAARRGERGEGERGEGERGEGELGGELRERARGEPPAGPPPEE